MTGRGLGDLVSDALSLIGVTEDRVSRWVSAIGYASGCGCKGRRERLNALGRWATRVLYGKVERAKEYLEEMTEE